MSNYTKSGRARCFVIALTLLLAPCFHANAAAVADESIPAEWEVLRETDTQTVRVSTEFANPFADSADAISLRLVDQDPTPGAFGPAVRRSLFEQPSAIRFDVRLQSGQEFPGFVLLDHRRRPAFRLVFSDGDRSRQLAWLDDNDWQAVGPLPVGEWLRVRFTFTGNQTLGLTVSDTDERELLSADDLPLTGYPVAMEFQLGGSSSGVGGDFIFSNVELEGAAK